MRDEGKIWEQIMYLPLTLGSGRFPDRGCSCQVGCHYSRDMCSPVECCYMANPGGYQSMNNTRLAQTGIMLHNTPSHPTP